MEIYKIRVGIRTRYSDFKCDIESLESNKNAINLHFFSSWYGRKLDKSC